jgi:beta-xylosidase
MTIIRKRNRPKLSLWYAAALAGLLAAAVATAPCRAGENVAWGAWTQWGDLGNGRYRNPVLPADYSDLDAIRVGDDYYAISSTFQFSPGMAVLHSRDLVNWRTVGHAVPDLTQITPELDWTRMNRYGRGVWAGAIRHHAGRFWIYFGTPDEGYFVTSAERPEGPWAPLHQVLRSPGWDDCAPFWDDDGKGYFIGTHFSDGYRIHVWDMTPDNLDLVPGTDRVIYQSKGSEANKLYKFNGTYYHFFSEVQGDLRVMMMRRAPSIRGPWSEKRQLMRGDVPAMQPNQGGIVQGPDGKWYFFTHHGSGDWAGRAASLLPVHWVDGWPVIGQPDAAGVGTMVWEGALPATGSGRQFPQGGGDFDAGTLAPVWEWNYQPRADKWSLSARSGYLRLHAFPGLDGGNLLKVGNVLTQRVVRTGGQSFATRLELAGMADGQHAGLVHFTAQPRSSNPAESTASAGIVEAEGKRYLEVSRDGAWTRLQPWPQDAIWVRSSWGLDGRSTLAVSADGVTYRTVLADVPLTWGAYRGSRVGMFTFNPAGERGYVDVDRVVYDVDNRATAPARALSSRQ